LLRKDALIEISAVAVLRSPDPDAASNA